jgi:hypothetical protein
MFDFMFWLWGFSCWNDEEIAVPLDSPYDNQGYVNKILMAVRKLLDDDDYDGYAKRKALRYFLEELWRQ